MSLSSSESATAPVLAAVADWQRVEPRAYGLWTLVAIALITAARLLWLAAGTTDLYPDEAQYWFWSLHPALGYYSKPPLVAWVIALTTSAFGNSELGIRLAAPLLHAAAAGFVYGAAVRLYDRRTGFWSAIAYASLPGVSLSAFVISTDAILMPCWAAALYAFIRAREPGGGHWWIGVGIAAGLGLLAKYAMAYWLFTALGYVLIVREERRHLRALLGAVAIALLLYLPNFWWNWSNGFVSYLHTRDNAELSGPLFHPTAFLEFFGSQFGVFGPLCFAALLAIVVRPRQLAEPGARLLAAFALPTLAMMFCISFLSRAQPNWAAPAYISATVLVVAWALQQDWRRGMRVAVAINLAIAVFLFEAGDALGAIGIRLPAKYDPLHRLHGWRALAQSVSNTMVAQPGLRLLADDRELLAALTYYVRPRPLDAVEWDPIPGIWDQWLLANNLAGHTGEDFLAVTKHALIDEMRLVFTEIVPLGTIESSAGATQARTYRLYILRGYRGPSTPEPRRR
ncbi:MAG: glycosyltransferase family 39 protein [Alphaproteobacteria bacterium]|nr:glycosyltransferase family 39 protein [Alphaproteobacteria bacterium]